MGKGDPKGGRPRVHDDARARKRAFYARHKDAEQLKASIRRMNIKLRKKTKMKTLDDRQRAMCRLLPKTTKVKGVLESIDHRTNLEAVLSALRADMGLWRATEQTDGDRFRSLTLRALDMREHDRPEDDVTKLITPLQERLEAVAALADKALDEAWRRDASEAVRSGSTWHQLSTLVRDAQRVESALGDIVIFYRSTADQFRELYEGGRLLWQLLL